MKAHQTQFGFSKSLLALAVIAACVPAFADDEEAKQLSTPQSSVSAGAASASGTTKDRSIWGQYNGMRQDGTTLILDLDIIKRNDADGTGLYLKGRNLGLDSRDLSFSYEKQGDWKVGLDYSELTHHEIRTVNTALQGAGTTTPSVVRLATPGTGSDLDMSLKRVGAGLSMEKWISNQWQFEASFKNEDKTGSRLTGRGYACAAFVCTGTQDATHQSWALLMLPEPVNSAIKQIDAKFNFHDQKLTVSAGYYGSFYTNNNGSYAATVPGQLNSPTGNLSTLNPAVAASVIAGGGTSLQNVLQLPTALPPDNQAHQLYVSGGYRFTPSTNSTFKYAYTHATQNKDFVASGLTGAPAGVSNLGGEVNNTLVQVGVTSKVAPKLSLLGNAKWEDKDDKTPDQLYNVDAGPNPTPPPANVNRYWNNYHASTTRFTAKGEAAYQLPDGYRGTLGLDYTSLDRPVPIQITDEELGGLGAMRSKLQEAGYRLELRRAIDETLTGALTYGNSRRTGGDWTSLSTSTLFVNNGLGYGQTGSASQFIKLNPNNAFPMSMVDVNREKIKLWTNWTPSERAAVNFTVENSTDTNATDYDPRFGQKGWSGASNLLINIDASYAVSDNWNINGYAAQGNQNQKINHNTGYQLDLKTVTNSLGVGVNGKATSRLELGATLSYLFDESRYGLGASNGIAGAYPNFSTTPPSTPFLNQVAIGLPNVSYEQTVVGLYGKYSLDKSAAIHMNLTQFNAKLKEWSWSNNGVPFTYSDNTTVGINPDQSVTYVGVAYVYKFY